jgi:hypothetical protein
MTRRHLALLGVLAFVLWLGATHQGTEHGTVWTWMGVVW